MTDCLEPAALCQALLPTGRQAIEYRAYPAGRSITLHTYRPASASADSPVVLVQHGVLRNGADYRDFWVEAAERHGLLIIAPTFDNQQWPQVVSYNNGNLLATCDASADASQAALNPPEEWSYAVINRLVEDLKTAGVLGHQKLYLFGHSAGGQFVHRLVSLLGAQAFAAVAVGNPGWYTLPRLALPFPEGLGGIGLDQGQVLNLLSYPLTILAGDQDTATATADPHLPSEPAALRQGPHRFARAANYYAVAQAEAARLGLPLAWQLHPIAGIGHDGRAMSAVCASLWFQGHLPGAAELAALAGAHSA